MSDLIRVLRFDLLIENPLSIVDILVLWIAIYQIILLVRRTRAAQMAWGLLAIVVMWWVTRSDGLIRLEAVHWVFGQLLLLMPIAIIVLFQQPIRQALTQFGKYPLRPWRPQDATLQVVEEVALACSAMASMRIGALIVFERGHGLRNYIETGIKVDAIVTYDLLTNIFTPKTPLHDGAVIIGEGRIRGASCFLPLTTNPYLSRTYGTRHRAAIGVTEETDAVAVVVSEERGMISGAVRGKFIEDLDTRGLRALLLEHLGGDASRNQSLKSLFARSARRGGGAEATETGP